MDQLTGEKPSRPFWRRPWGIALIAAGGLVVLCAAFVLLVIVLPGSQVSQAQQQLAQQALKSPTTAPLHLGGMGDLDGWLKAGPNDYAVQDGMVIITPGPTRFASIFPIAGDNVADLKTPVLVYAPDGSDLSRRPTPPDQVGGYSGIQWFLYDCHPASSPLWWGCTLRVGSSI